MNNFLEFLGLACILITVVSVLLIIVIGASLWWSSYRRCPKCRGPAVQDVGFYQDPWGYSYNRYLCKKCGHYWCLDD